MADTIVALASGRLPAGVAVLRISGPRTRFAVETIAGALPPARTASYRTFRTPSREIIDTGLLLFFPSPKSFTGEDCAEFHLHGSKATVAALLSALTDLEGVRLAEAGEFTRRAFVNGKVDLLETEALADLISAETEGQRRHAVLNAQGGQSELYQSWRERLIRGRAMVEAELDFSDEGDVPGSVSAEVWADMAALREEIAAHIGQYHRSEIIRDGYDVVIVGAPNAGKSSLLNAIARRDAAIVSEEPGTTRDLVEVVIDLAGVKVRLTDTAGIRSGAGKVEAIGIARALDRVEQADLILLVDDGSGVVGDFPAFDERRLIRVASKSDLHAGGNQISDAVTVSALTGKGLEELLAAISERAVEAVGNLGDILPSRLRHKELLELALAGLDDASTNPFEELELRADDLRRAADSIGRISGAVDVEDLLDVIFAQFCIGK